MNITGETKVKEIAVANPRATGFLSRPEWTTAAGVISPCTTHAHMPTYLTEEIMARLEEKKAEVGPDDVNWASARLAISRSTFARSTTGTSARQYRASSLYSRK